jgi:hypothetical protein
MSETRTDNKTLACPSSRPESPQSAVFGIVDNRGDFPIIRYLDQPIPATAEVLALTEGEHPHQVFRFTSPCQEGRCAHFSQGQCGLPRLIQNHLPSAQQKHVSCPIRNQCRWFYQESFEACARCSAIVTDEYVIVDGHLLSPSGPPEPPKESPLQKTS